MFRLQVAQTGTPVTWVKPQAAFYLLVDISGYLGMSTPNNVVIEDAVGLCVFLLESARVALVPGEAFGCPGTVRIAYSTGMPQLEEAMARLIVAFSELQLAI
jgi:aspartate/methionine/tyrosine aminotransferase